jgi:hypothetical protein
MARIYAAVFAVVGWWAVIGQYVVTYAGTPEAVHYLSFFTILSNILVALTFSVAALAPHGSAGKLLLRPPMATATALYITVTGLVYYFMLASLYDLSGWTKVYNSTLHYALPPAYVLFWLAFVQKGTLRLRHALWMLAAPMAYGVYTLARGAMVAWYPYPFLNAAELGYPRTFWNIGEFLIIFIVGALAFLLLDNVLGRFGKALPHGKAG